MIGVFDSGAGGKLALQELRKAAPSADICFFADFKNAPYGEKSEEELVGLVRENINVLKSAGATRILMACCTASTVYHLLSEAERGICQPIIAPTAAAALKAASGGPIAVIATKATVKSHAFSREIKAMGYDGEVLEYEAQCLVSLGERVGRGEKLTDSERELVFASLEGVRRGKPEVLILGCTHFPWLSDIISDFMKNTKLISSAREGALACSDAERINGRGITVYLDKKGRIKNGKIQKRPN